MNIVYTTNDAFADKVGTSICSVYENNRDVEELSVYVIGQDLSLDNKKKFRRLAKRHGREIWLIDLGPLEEYFDFPLEAKGWSPIVLSRLLMDKLLPDTLERALYLDGDTVDIRSLGDLWATDLHGKVLGGCIEATYDRKKKRKLGLESYPYINAGVLLVDLKKWKEADCFRRIVVYYQEHQTELFAAEQDAINAVLKDEIYYLPPKYNFYNIYWFYPYRVLRKLMGQAHYYAHQTYDESMRNPTIIHYLGEERPWRKGNHHRFLKYYEKYHARTPWKDVGQEKGWELYFRCWGIFNACMKPFPTARYWVMNHLIPLFIKGRERQWKKAGKQGS